MVANRGTERRKRYRVKRRVHAEAMNEGQDMSYGERQAEEENFEHIESSAATACVIDAH